MRVRVYKNLHKDTFSIKDWESKSATYNKVVGYSQNIALTNATFIVSQKGRERVLQEQTKNVHAYVQGDYLPFESEWLYWADLDLNWEQVSYNPYKSDTFFTLKGNQPITSSAKVLIFQNKLFAHLQTPDS